jgi:hypothetical protein
MSTLTETRREGRRGVPNRFAVTVAGFVGSLACLVYVAGVVIPLGENERAVAHHPLVLIPDIVTAAAFIVLAVTLPALAASAKLPVWALYASAAGCAFMAAISWVGATFLPHVMTVISEDQAHEVSFGSDVYMDLFGLPKIVLCMVGFLALGIVGWRRKAIPVGAAILLILGGLVSFLGTPWPAGVFAGAGLAWIARSTQARTDRWPAGRTGTGQPAGVRV